MNRVVMPLFDFVSTDEQEFVYYEKLAAVSVVAGANLQKLALSLRDGQKCLEIPLLEFFDYYENPSTKHSAHRAVPWRLSGRRYRTLR
jgi:hypothetical protein